MIKKVLITVVALGIVQVFFDLCPFGYFLYFPIAFVLTVLMLVIFFSLITDFNILQVWGLVWKKHPGRPFLKMKYKNIVVSYRWGLQGGGIILAYEFVRLVSRHIGKVDHVFEYCSGPGFIGFGLLAYGLCDRLTFADVNPAALEAVRETIRNNNLQDKVTVYQSDCLDAIPPHERWDLVVGNPPWDLVEAHVPWYQRYRDKRNMMVADPEGRVHQKFYRDIKKFLKPQGSILFVEGSEYTTADSFRRMIQENGLKINEIFRVDSFPGIFKNFKEYPEYKISRLIFLRFVLYCREVYFIWCKQT